MDKSIHDTNFTSTCKVKICEANTNGTLQVTIPAKAAEVLGWKAGDTLTPVILKGHRDGTQVPFAITYHKTNGTNGLKLGTHKAINNDYIFEAEEAE